MSASSDRNLLFGLLALKMDFVSRDALLEGMGAWLDRKADALGLILQERGALSGAQCQAIDALLACHVSKHGDEGRGLASVGVAGDLRAALSRLGDPEVQESVAAAHTTPASDGEALAWRARAAGPLRYRALRPLARGGLGEVHVALDEELGREVALKEIRPEHADRAASRLRFVREAEVTGKLEHPGVVPVHGMGTYPDGRPYYAMRLIRGETMHETIVRFHRDDEGRRDPGERELALRGLLARFVAVCQAVAYAHSRGVIHRDLKPANVMVGEYGETLVVDWGLAKVLDQPEGATAVERPVAVSVGDATQTEMGQAVGTPAYMPPEQARGEHDQEGAASDVWALGATLYCLLTGRPPYGGKDAVEAARRGDVAPARQVNRRVPAALEAVCLRAMALRPEERYGSARALAADVERWLADEPVTAMPEPWRDRARRWARRNRVVVSSGVALLLAGVVGLGAGLAAVRAEERRTAAERDRAVKAEGVASQRLVQVEKAEAEARANLTQARAHLRKAEENDRQMRGSLEQSFANFQLARKVVDECFGIARDHPLLEGPNLSPDLHQLKRLLLEKALPFYQDLRARRRGDQGMERDVWKQHMSVAYIQQELGSKPEALETYRQAEQLARALVKAQPSVPTYQDGLAGTLTNRGRLQSDLGQPKEARDSYQESATLQRALVKAQPGVPLYLANLGLTLTNLGNVQFALGQPKEALPSHQESARLYRALVKAQPNAPEYQGGLALALNGMGRLQSALGQPKEARGSYEEAARLQRALVKAQPSVPKFQDGLARTLNNLGVLQSALGQPKEARDSYQESASLLRALVKAQPSVPQYQDGLASSLTNLGVLQSALGQPKEALRTYEESATLYRALVQALPKVPTYQVGLARALYNLGRLQSALGQPKEAVPSYQESASLLRALVKAHPGVPEYQEGLARTLNNLGILQSALGQPKEAVQSYVDSATPYRALVQAQPNVPAYRLDLCRPLFSQAMLLRHLGRAEEARRALDDALNHLAGLARTHSNLPQLAFFRYYAHRERAHALAGTGRPHAAVADFDRALALAPPAERLAVRLARADALARAGDHSRAAAEALDLARFNWPSDVLYNLACVLSLSAAAAHRDDARPLPLRDRLAEQHARAAVALLHRASRAGWRDAAHADRDRDLDFLRPRTDYQRWRGTLAPADE